MKKNTCEKLVDSIFYYWGEAVSISGKVDAITNDEFEDYVENCACAPYDGSELERTVYGLTNSQKRELLKHMIDIYEYYSQK